MSKISTIAKQSLFDMANQECGSITAVFEMALANDISITDIIEPGTKIKVPSPINPDIANYFKGKNKKIATAIELEQDQQQDQLLYVFPYILPMI